jgi:hypothetical protein
MRFETTIGDGRSRHTAVIANWAIELAEESPVLVVPWQDDSGSVAYVDLRGHAEAIDEIPEARANPALAGLLLALNAPESRWATAKCDRWELDDEDLEAASFELELVHDERYSSGVGSYVDIYLLDPAQFVSLEHHRELLERLTQALICAGAEPRALLELTLRRCIAGGSDGYAITAFVYAMGGDAESAQANWADALDALAKVLESC